MTNSVLILYYAPDAPTVEKVRVDLTNYGVNVTHRFNNPIIFIPTPAMVASSKTFTATGGSSTLSCSNSFIISQAVTLSNSGGTLPTGFTVGAVYFVVAQTSSTIKLSATVGGTAITPSDAGTGTHTITDMSIAGTNQIGFNLGFFDNAFDLQFTLMVDSSPGTFNFATGTTDYEKLAYLALDPIAGKNPKIIQINGGPTYAFQIEAFRFPWLSGQANLAQNCTMSCRLTKYLPM